MLKYAVYLILMLVVIGGGIGIFHLYKVAQKNKAEMAKYDQSVAYRGRLGKVLVVYYSMTGHTKEIAEMIAEVTSADVYEITLKIPYTSPSVYMKSKKELEKKEYPALSGGLPDVENYNIIFVGGPVWWYTMATPLYSFLEQVDFGGKKVVPFSTQGSNFGTFFADFAKQARHAEIQKSENFNNLGDEYKEAVRRKVNTWLNNLSD